MRNNVDWNKEKESASGVNGACDNFAWRNWEFRKFADIDPCANNAPVCFFDRKTTLEFGAAFECVLFDALDTWWDVDCVKILATFECTVTDVANWVVGDRDDLEVSAVDECAGIDFVDRLWEREELSGGSGWECEELVAIFSVETVVVDNKVGVVVFDDLKIGTTTENFVANCSYVTGGGNGEDSERCAALETLVTNRLCVERNNKRVQWCIWETHSFNILNVIMEMQCCERRTIREESPWEISEINTCLKISCFKWGT